MQKITISEHSDADQRLDKFLKKFFPNLALGAMYKMLRTGKIKVSGKKKEQNYRLTFGDEIEIFLNDEEISALQKVAKNPEASKKQKSPLEIIYQDDFLLIVNKSAGVNVHPWDHKTSEVSLIEQIHDFLGKKYNSLTFKPSLVHRIDRDTSGCLIVALQKNILEKLLSELQNHKIEKIYHTIVVGKMPKPRDTIDAKLLRRENAKDEAKVIVSPDWQRAITHYKTLREFNIGDQIFSLLECKIETGRTHQIRVHLAHSGCPIVGDKAYGNRKINAFIKNNLGIDRQLLHANSLEFFHPGLGKKIKIEAPYKSDFEKFLK